MAMPEGNDGVLRCGPETSYYLSWYRARPSNRVSARCQTDNGKMNGQTKVGDSDEGCRAGRRV